MFRIFMVAVFAATAYGKVASAQGITLTNTYFGGASVSVELRLWQLQQIDTAYETTQVGVDVQGTYPNLIFVPVFQTTEVPIYGMVIVDTLNLAASEVDFTYTYTPYGPSGPLPEVTVTGYSHHKVTFTINGTSWDHYDVLWTLNSPSP